VSLLTEYPPWFLLFCLLAGAAFSAFLYYRRRGQEIRRSVLLVLRLLRFLSVSLLAFLLLSPQVRRTAREIEKPVVAIGVDGSLSVGQSSDSAEVKKRLNEQINKLSSELSGRFEVALYTFGQDVSPGLPSEFRGNHTDISEFFTELGSRYLNRNLGAVIIATDGLYNKGTNPAYESARMGIPVYCIALGDTSLHRDVFIRNINASRQVYLDDQFPFEILAELDKYTGKEARLLIRHKGVVVFSKTLAAGSERAIIRVNGLLQAKEKGLQKYSVEIETDGEEFNKGNNKRDFFVDVMESRIRVAVVYESPHPDIAAIVSALGSSLKFEVSQMKTSGLSDRSKQYDLYILYQLPSVAGIQDPLKLIPPGSPVLYILGSQTDLSGFNRLKTGLIINAQRKTMTDIQPVLNQNFSLFGIEKDAAGLIQEFPPLQCPSGTFQTGVLSDVLLYQKIGNISTRFPLIMFFDLPERKTGIIAGENIWRWRISDYMQKSDFRLFDDMICRIIQYLSVKTDPSPFRVIFKERLEEGDPLEFDATLFNPGREPVNNADVVLELKNEEGKSYPYVFSRTEKAYYLNAGYFPAGNYTFDASVKTLQGTYRKQGRFSITPLDIELVNLVADHGLLRQISAKNSGAVVSQKEISLLGGMLQKRNDLKSIIHLQRKYTELAGEWWLFLLLLALLSAEWAIRKRNGM